MNEENILSNIEDLLTPFLEKKKLSFSQLDPNSSLVADGIIDSIAFVGIILELEDRLGVTLDFAEVDPKQFVTINGLVEFITNSKDIS